MKSKRKQLNRALLDAVVMRDVDHVRELLSRSADVNARDMEHDETPIILATKFADTSMIRLLLDAAVEVNDRDDKGRTALFYTPVSSEAFKALLEAGADVHVRDKEGDTILMRSISESASLAEVEELLRLGIEPGVQNDAGETALDVADSLGLVLVVERLKSSTAV